ncbi:MAG: hypothetical protein Kow0092_36980 [Deferrisomatales bacterium]
MRDSSLLPPAATALVALVALLSGCASTRKLAEMSPGEEQVVDRLPDDKPSWLEVPFEEHDGQYLFKGEASGSGDPALCMRQAKANGVQHLVEAIRVRARSDFSEAVRGVNVSEDALGRYLDNVVAWTSESVEVSGIVCRGEYREKVQVRTYGGARYRYDCFVRLAIPVESYLRAREAALSRATVQPPDEEAKRLAHETQQKLAP